jgi:hypothetical protein
VNDKEENWFEKEKQIEAGEVGTECMNVPNQI